MSNNETLIDDLDFAAKIAREGANTPLLGGPFFLIWSGLLIPTLLIHWSLLKQLLPVEINEIGLLWLAYGAIGGGLSAIVGKRRASKVGCSSFLNRLSRISGISICFILFSFVVGVVVATNIGMLGLESYNLILPFAFGLQAFHMNILGFLSGKNYLKRAAYVAGASMLITLIFNNTADIYFLSAVGVFFGMALPGYFELKDEKNHVS